MTGKYLLLALLATAAFAQDPVSITPYQLLDARSGQAVACSGCSIYTYAAGTNTPLATYTSSTLATPNTNPVLTNSAGYAVNGATITGIWVGSSCYKFVAKDSSAVTIFTQDNICDRGAVLKALLATSAGAGLVGFSQSTSYSASTVGAHLKDWIDVKDAPYSALMDGSTNDTAAFLAALTAASSANKALHIPGGTILVTSVNLTTSSPVSIICDGAKSTTIKRHNSALQASTPLLKITNASAVSIEACGFNQLGDGSNYANAASTVYLTNAATIYLDGNYSTLGQSNAFLIDGGVGNITFTNNEVDHIWNSAFAVGGTGTVGTPVPVNRIIASNNRLNEIPQGIQISVFADSIAMTGNVGTNTAYALVQHVNHVTLTGNVITGTATYGNPVGPFDCFFAEGVSDFNASGNFFSGCSKNGMFVQGSELTIGTNEQLPILRASILNNHIESAASSGINVVGWSFDHTLIGRQVVVKGNTVTNSQVGYSLGALDNFEFSGNTADTIQTDGVALSIVRNGSIYGNRIFRVGQLTANTYYGINIGNDNASLTNNLFIDYNTIVDTTGKMRIGVNNDALGTGGYQNLVRHWGNTISGQFAGNPAWAPTPIAPTSGAWLIGDQIENFATSGYNVASGWINTASGSPGTWSPVSYQISADCAVATATNAACGTSARGFFIIAAGAGTTNVFTSAQSATSKIMVTQVSGSDVNALLGVTCNTAYSGGFVQDTLAGGGRFTVNAVVGPTVNPACYAFTIDNN